MHQFTDRSGRRWLIQIDVSTIKRVRSLTGVNLLDIVSGELIERLTNDPILLADVLYAVVQPQALTQGISDEAFGQGLAGNSIAEATAALLEGLVDFFPEPKGRLIGKAATKYQQVQTKALAMIEARIDSPALEQQILSELESQLQSRTSNDSSTESPESLGSIPAD